ncbi:hypothetical protein WANG_p1058 (plasmid) [Lactobacillus kefiranofaciens subsp. kefiranofaciens]|nr:hypothetical protein WANG_p1058 [Lactobacillus kefiranofaciens subsp. kefiranofaciens]
MTYNSYKTRDYQPTGSPVGPIGNPFSIANSANSLSLISLNFFCIKITTPSSV